MSIQNICVMGTLRSGKTLVSRALNMHPSVSVQVEPYFFFFKLCRNIFHRDILKDVTDPNRPILSGFGVPGRERALFEETFSRLQFGEEDIQELQRLTVLQQESAGSERAPLIIPLLQELKKGSAKEVLRNLMQILALAYPKDALQYIGISEGWCDEFITPLSKAQGFKCVHILRDPRSVIASRNYGVKVKEKYGGKSSILFLIRHWRKSVAYSIINKDDPGHLTIKYEDLVASPEHWFKTICNHMNIPFDDTLLHPEKYVNGINKFWKQNTNFMAGKGFSVVAINRWREVLPKEDIGFIEWLCAPEMKFLGYDAAYGNYSLNKVASHNESEKDIIDWLKPYNLLATEDELQKEITRRHLLDIPDYVSSELKKYYFYDDLVFEKIMSKQL